MPQVSSHVIQRFPRYAVLILKLADESDEFASLCDDYTLVVETLRRLERSTLERSTQARRDEVIADYRTYLIELELEIADALTAASM
jgi:hypothetical protein